MIWYQHFISLKQNVVCVCVCLCVCVCVREREKKCTTHIKQNKILCKYAFLITFIIELSNQQTTLFKIRGVVGSGCMQLKNCDLEQNLIFCKYKLTQFWQVICNFCSHKLINWPPIAENPTNCNSHELVLWSMGRVFNSQAEEPGLVSEVR